MKRFRYIIEPTLLALMAVVMMTTMAMAMADGDDDDGDGMTISGGALADSNHHCVLKTQGRPLCTHKSKFTALADSIPT